MKNQNIQSILQGALEDEIPSSKVRLWPVVKASLVADKTLHHRRGEKMNTIQLHRRPGPAIVFLMIVGLLVIAFITPQGRSLAQSIVQFFLRAESTTFPLQDSQIMGNEPDPSSPTAEPPGPLLSVAEAEAKAGFAAAEPPRMPEGFNYLGARLYGNAISIEYEAHGSGGHLILMQSREGFVQSDWDKVPANAIIPVKIGERDGEFVQGTFVVYAGETSATWNSDAPILRLRWMENGIWFELTKFGDVETIEYLDREGLIKLAESLTIKP